MSEQSLYERVGGEAFITTMVGAFYERVLADPLLEPFFRHVEMDKLINMQIEFFSTALGGPLHYSEKQIYHAHFGKAIKQKHFAQFVNHLLKTLQHLELKTRDIEDIIARVNTYVDDVVGGHGLDS